MVQADTDGSGSLDVQELSLLVRDFYKEEGLHRPLAKAETPAPAMEPKPSLCIGQVEEEVICAMRDHDLDGSGALNFEEFMAMVCQSTAFRFRLCPFLHPALCKTPNPLNAGREAARGRQGCSDGAPHRRERSQWARCPSWVRTSAHSSRGEPGPGERHVLSAPPTGPAGGGPQACAGFTAPDHARAHGLLITCSTCRPAL